MIKELNLDEIDVQSFVESDRLEMSIDTKIKMITLKISDGYSITRSGGTSLIEKIEITISSWDNIYVKAFNSVLGGFENVSRIRDALLLNICEFIHKSGNLELHGYMRDKQEWAEWLITNPKIRIIATYREQLNC